MFRSFVFFLGLHVLFVLRCQKFWLYEVVFAFNVQCGVQGSCNLEHIPNLNTAYASDRKQLWLLHVQILLPPFLCFGLLCWTCFWGILNNPMHVPIFCVFFSGVFYVLVFATGFFDSNESFLSSMWCAWELAHWNTLKNWIKHVTSFAKGCGCFMFEFSSFRSRVSVILNIFFLRIIESSMHFFLNLGILSGAFRSYRYLLLEVLFLWNRFCLDCDAYAGVQPETLSKRNTAWNCVGKQIW